MTSKRRLLLALAVVLVGVVLLVVTRGGGSSTTGSGDGSATTVTLAPAVRPSSAGGPATTNGSGAGTTRVTAPRTTANPPSSVAPGASTTRATTGPAPAGMKTVAISSLPPEARTTLRLIAADGPFPYRQDGVVFENRERHLPKKASGYYHEYTVVTPGSPDRGARRIITGANGDHFYTSDHYATFRLVVDG
jgi:ribonuclease T1